MDWHNIHELSPWKPVWPSPRGKSWGANLFIKQVNEFHFGDFGDNYQRAHHVQGSTWLRLVLNRIHSFSDLGAIVTERVQWTYDKVVHYQYFRKAWLFESSTGNFCDMRKWPCIFILFCDQVKVIIKSHWVLIHPCYHLSPSLDYLQCA